MQNLCWVLFFTWSTSRQSMELVILAPFTFIACLPLSFPSSWILQCCNDRPKNFRKQMCWFITSGSTCHHQELWGRGADILFQNYRFQWQPLNVTHSELSLNRTYRAYIYYKCKLILFSCQQRIMVGFIYTEVISLVTCVRPCTLISRLVTSRLNRSTKWFQLIVGEGSV